MLTTKEVIIVSAFLIMISSSIFMVVLAYFNNKRFLEVCRLYEIEFGFLPLSAATFKDSDIIGFSSGYWVKMSFIIRPLVFGKQSGYSKNNDVEFMKKLPNSIKKWFLAEYYCAAFGCAAGLIMVILVYVDKMF